MKIKCWAAQKAGANLTNYEYTPKELSSYDIEVSITHCGICHSDIHLIDNDWQMSAYPLVPGHEIIGTVNSKGSLVKDLNVGDRVGIGWQRSACLECDTCVRGDDNLCSQNQATCVGNHGGFAESIRSDSRFAFRIPEKLTSENAAPLLCGGVTVFAPLKRWVNSQMKVGVIGIGGLGHLALQYAAAFGCHVTAFSSSPDKKAEAEKFGAHDFISDIDKSTSKRYRGRFDFILSTVYADLDWTSYMNLLGPKGILCFVGASSAPLAIPVFSLIGGSKMVCGSAIGSRNTIREMLEFSERHGICAKTESVSLSEANSAIQRVRDGKARYRMVLKNR